MKISNNSFSNTHSHYSQLTLSLTSPPRTSLCSTPHRSSAPLRSPPHRSSPPLYSSHTHTYPHTLTPHTLTPHLTLIEIRAFNLGLFNVLFLLFCLLIRDFILSQVRFGFDFACLLADSGSILLAN